MARLMINIYFKTDEYDVEVNEYNNEGRLEEALRFNSVKQLVLHGVIVRINRQLYSQPWSIIVEATDPHVELREGGILYVVERGSSDVSQ